MSRRASIGWGLVGAVMAAAVGTHGCADDEVSIRVICNAFAEVDGDRCTYSAEECQFNGRFNPIIAPSYKVFLTLESGLSGHSSDVPLRAEPNGIQVREAEVFLTKLNGVKIKFGIKNPFTIPLSGYVAPGSRSVVQLEAIPEQYATLLRGEASKADSPLRDLLVNVVIRGRTAGGEDVESAQWTYPVELLAVDTSRGVSCFMAEEICQDQLGQDGFALACAICEDGVCAPVVEE